MTSLKSNLTNDLAKSQLIELKRAARVYEQAALSSNTRRGYESDFEDFVRWCGNYKRNALPASPETVALYLTRIADQLKVSSFRRRITAISKIHELSKFASPTKNARVKSVVRGIIHSKDASQSHATPTLLNHIKQMVGTLPHTNKGIRDKAILLIGFASGLRRSEIVALDIKDLSLSEEGLVIKTQTKHTGRFADQRVIAITYGNNPTLCPIKALGRWLEVSGINEGAIFRSIDQWQYISPRRLTDQSIRLILKETIKKAGITEKGFSGHSLRAGFVTVAAMNGASEKQIQKTTGHTSLEVLRRYVRDANIFRNSASRKLGL